MVANDNGPGGGGYGSKLLTVHFGTLGKLTTDGILSFEEMRVDVPDVQSLARR